MKKSTNKMVVSGMMIALGSILSMLKLYELPFGGTVTVASMVPVVLVGYIYGVKWGLFTSFIYSVLQLILGVATGIVSRMFLPGDEQMVLTAAISICVLDYILAYVMLGFGGVFKGKMKSKQMEIVLGAALCIFLCWVMHTLSGFIFYGAWAEWFFSDAATGLAQIPALTGFCNWVLSTMNGKTLALFYSMVYNGAYMLPELVITAVFAPVVFGALKRSSLVE